MITLYEMRDDKIRNTATQMKIAYFLREDSTGYRSLVMPKISHLALEGNTLLDDDTNSFKQWQADDNIVLTPIAQIPTTYEFLTDQYPELLL